MKQSYSTDDFEHVFYSKQLRPKGYDREIDEGMGSGMKRFATIDVSDLSSEQVNQFIDEIESKLFDFNLCSDIQVVHFRADLLGKKFVSISGICHILDVAGTRDMMRDRLDKLEFFNRARLYDDVRFVPII